MPERLAGLRFLMIRLIGMSRDSADRAGAGAEFKREP